MDGFVGWNQETERRLYVFAIRIVVKDVREKHCNIIESDEVVFPYHNNVNDDVMDGMEWGRRVTIQSLDCLSVCLHEQAKTPELGQASK